MLKHNVILKHVDIRTGRHYGMDADGTFVDGAVCL